MTTASPEKPLPSKGAGEPPPSNPHPSKMGFGNGIEGGMERELAQRFQEDAEGGTLFHPVLGVITLILFWPTVGHFQAGVWFGLLLLATGARFSCGRRAKEGDPDPTRVRRLLFCGVAAVAAAWSLGGILFGAEVPDAELGILLVIMAGLVAAGTTTLVAHPPSFHAFSSLLLGSIFAAVLMRGMDRFHFLLLLIVVAFWAVMAFLHSRAWSQLMDSLKTSMALAQAREEYRGLVESARDLVWRVDNQGRWSFLNAASRDIYGAPAEELLGEVALDRADDENREADYAAFAKVLMGGELVDHETIHHTIQGGKRYLSFSARPLRNTAGEIKGAVGTARDVTDRARARSTLEQLLQKNSLVRSLINTTSDLIFYKDEHGHYQGCNLAFSDFTGLPEEELIGKTDVDLVGPEKAALYAESDREAVSSQEPVRLEEWVEFPGQGRRLMETVKTVYRSEDNRVLGVLGIVRDVTERKEAEDRMRDLAEKAEHATRMKSAFLANMSHEIRTPMNGILGMTEIILDSELTGEQRQALEIVRNSGEALLEILNDILDLSKIEAGHLELEEISFDLHEVVAGAAQLFTIPASARGNELVLDIRPEVPRGVQGDPTRLRQILSNLVGNAVKFTKGGEILVRVGLLEETGSGARLHFSVKDTGVGIPLEKQGTIFQEFTQADSSTTRQFGGTGLGLTISRHLIAHMGGELDLSSTPGEGSDFFFTLEFPLDSAFASVEQEVDLAAFQGLKTLVVDDNETNRRIFTEFLESVGVRVTTAPSAEEGLRFLEEAAEEGEPFRLALLDLLMPERDGFQLAEDIRARWNPDELRLMILTSTSRPGDRRRATSLGVGSFLLKPIPRSDLFTGMASTLEGHIGSREGMGASDPGVTRAATPVAPERSGGQGASEPSGFRILLAEDNMVNQQVAVALLNKWGHSVRVVGTGVEAVEAVGSEDFDLVLMDVQMPEMDGLEATRRIRSDARFSSLPIIAITAHALREERDRCADAGMNDHLSKPFKPEDLKAHVEKWVGALPAVPSSPSQARTSNASPSPVSEPTTSEDPPVLLDLFRESMREAGIESVVESAVSIYLSEIPERMRALEAAVAEGDFQRVEREAHALKSGSKNIRADELGKLLDDLETAGVQGDSEAVASLFPRVDTACAAVRDYLKEMGFRPE